MIKVLYIALGGALGSVLRYLSAGLLVNLTKGGFPWGTLFVNLLGSLLIGLFWGLTEKNMLSMNMRMFLLIGLFGGFTTFSTFSLEFMNLIRSGQINYAILYVLGTNTIGLSLVFGGYYLSRTFYAHA